MENKQLKMTISEEKGRIDKVLANQFTDYTRTVIQQWLKEKAVTVNGEVVKANYKVKQGDMIHITIPEEEVLEIIAEDIPLDIVYEDQDVLVVNKPSGMVVHPSIGHTHGTLVNALLFHLKGDFEPAGESFRPGIVHRIDKDTSGLLVIAKNPKAHLGLSEQLMDHSMQRSYVALVEGNFPHETGTINAPLKRSPQNRLKRMVDKEGKRAVTHFEVLEQFNGATLLSLQLETGRTHQIRAHMEYINHPIINDPMYHPKANVATEYGQFLHAQTLGFIQPVTGEELFFTSEVPTEFIERSKEYQNEL
ncbi:23S rRNA pseudouridine1911/1915/1917 synthase [Granulicatella balaenopterae]|uniref:Pseudouridine synthase n=1 Tax=Granulicatella balaenopterae TaxID=137733 RepID=A0A1H9K0B9_9LACT|nr:RluA family pseudouridine synthase [Granulicatella balaenopterae]SEQ92686.1 23S rRNA pseudouridine1911/1915/1917 synthase [Granulicatella balaenopterae]